MNERAYRRFSGAWFLQGAKTFGWVSVITLLIWVYADTQFTEERTVLATLRIATTWAGQPVTLEQPVSIALNGNNYAIERFIASLSAGGGVLNYASKAPCEPGGRIENTADILASLPPLRNSGLQVLSATPGGIEVNEAYRVFADVPVEVEGAGAELAEPPRVEPRAVEVRVRVREYVKADLSKRALARAVVDLREVSAEGLVTRLVEVTGPSGLADFRCTPARVRVALRISQPTTTKKLTVTVQVKSPKGWLEDDTWARLKLQVKPPEDWTRQISVTGNVIELEKLGPQDVSAYITLTEDDKQRQNLQSWWPGPVKIELPPKLRLAEPVAPVNYRLVEKAAAAPAAP
jgi:hypothetical protein